MGNSNSFSQLPLFKATIVSSSDGPSALSGGLNAVATGASTITQKDAHLVLSSSADSIVHVSSSARFHRVTAATLPANSIDLSGAIVWVTDRNALAIYGPLGWMRLASGTL